MFILLVPFSNNSELALQLLYSIVEISAITLWFATQTFSVASGHFCEKFQWEPLGSKERGICTHHNPCRHPNKCAEENNFISKHTDNTVFPLPQQWSDLFISSQKGFTTESQWFNRFSLSGVSWTTVTMAFDLSYMSLPSQSSPASCLHINLSPLRIKHYYTWRSRRYPRQSGSKYFHALTSLRCRDWNSAVFVTDKMPSSVCENLRQTKVLQEEEIVG